MATRKDVNSRLFIVDKSKQLFASGFTIDNLLPGQIGMFDASTGKSVASDTPEVEVFYFAMGVGTGSTLTDIICSPEIQRSATYAIETNCFTPYVPPIKAIKDFNPSCDTTYSISVLVRTDMSKSFVGARPISKSYPVLTACCDDPCACGGGNCNDLAVRYAQAVMSDPDKLVTCYLVANADANDPDATRIDPFDQAAIDAAITAGGDGFCLALQFEPNLENIATYCSLIYSTNGENWDNAGLPAFTFDLATTVGHKCMGTIINVRDAVYPSMTLADINLQEYFQQAYIGGLPNGPYRALSTGQPTTDYKIQPKFGTDYSVLSITVKNTHHIGQNDRDHYVDVQFAFPCAGAAQQMVPIITEITSFFTDVFGWKMPSTKITELSSCTCS